jgi:hypothetical protein
MPNHAEIGNSINKLAKILESQNLLEASEKLYRETLQFREKNPDYNKKDIINSMNNLARVLLRLNQLK